MKRMLLLVGIGVGLAASTFAAVALGGRAEPVALDTLGVVAREGECVQFAHINYIRGATTGSSNAVEAVAKLGGTDFSPDLDSAVMNATGLVQNVLADGEVVLEQLENGLKVAAYLAVDLGNDNWVVTEYEYSGPCSLH
jgi:hypothetical protein